MGVPGLLSFLIKRLKHEEKRREALGEKGETNTFPALHRPALASLYPD
jgi:hypothetical protein